MEDEAGCYPITSTPVKNKASEPAGKHSLTPISKSATEPRSKRHQRSAEEDESSGDLELNSILSLIEEIEAH